MPKPPHDSGRDAATVRDEASEPRHAAAAGLVHVSDSEPGIRRIARGKGFSYMAPGGGPVSPDTLRRVRHLAIPPAWTDVWIAPDARGHIQATGRDARGRKQYLYHTAWREFRDRHKFAHIVEFAERLPALRRQVAEHMALRGLPHEKVLATVVALLDRTLIRVGNTEYARENGSYGLTTLRERHIAIEGSELRFQFKGKSGRIWRLPIRDRRIARIVRALQELPGQHLFKYAAEDGTATTVDSADVNGYLHDIAGNDFSAKDFRTWAGTVLAVTALAAIGGHESEAQAKRQLRKAIEVVAARLGNTITICRKCYVHPDVVACYLEGTMPELRLPAAMPTLGADSGLSPEEEAVLALLKSRAGAATAASPAASGATPPLEDALVASIAAIARAPKAKPA